MSENTEMTNDMDRARIYEVGFHIVPLVAEESVSAEVTKLKDGIEKIGGIVISEDAPKLRPLAYSVDKEIGGRLQHFDSAYFGWIKFEADASGINAYKTELETNTNVLRFLIVKTVRENTLVSKRPVVARSEFDADAKPVKVAGEEVAEVSPEAIDSAIDKLVIE